MTHGAGDCGEQVPRRTVLGALAGVGVGTVLGSGTAAAAGGDKLWEFETGGEVESSPTVANGTVFVGSRYPDNSVYALDAGVVGSSEGSRVLLGTLGHHENRADRVTAPSPVFFEVTIEDATEPSAGETLEVTVEIENTGDQSDTQTLSLSAYSLGNDSVTVSLDGGDSTTRTLSLSTGEGDAGEYDVTASTDDDSTKRRYLKYA